jgi:hypothetical protein
MARIDLCLVQVLFWHFHGGTEERGMDSRIAGIPTDIRTKRLGSTALPLFSFDSVNGTVMNYGR